MEWAVQCNLKYYICSYVLMSCGTGLIFVWPLVLQNLLTLQPGSYLFKIWKDPPTLIQTDVYLFNWTNPEDIRNQTFKPKFKEIGPYRFWEKKKRCNITWNINRTITFRTQNFYYFDNNKTVKSDLEEHVTIPNIIANSITYLPRNASLKTTMSVTHSVKKILYSDFKKTNNLSWLNTNEAFSFKSFGFFYKANGSCEIEGLQTIGTGSSNLGEIYKWNHRSQTPFYEQNCSNIYGSSGDLYVPNQSKDAIAVFIVPLGRTVVLKYVGETKVRNILGYKYILERYSLDNGTLFPENKCFCNGECVPSGLFNISSSRGAPLFASLPHFYGADPYYINLIEGLHPNQKKHEFYLVLEPITGILLEANINLQINLLMQDVPGVRLFGKIHKRFLPVFWSSQRFELPESEVLKLELLKSGLVICMALGTLLLLIGLFVLLTFVYKFVFARKKYLATHEEQRSPLRESEEI